VISFDAELQQRLTDLRGQGLLRELRRVDSPQGTRILVGGQTLLNFSSNDYLGLANDRGSSKPRSRRWKSSAPAPAHRD
jgi:7-keto-8-aminopelargonate synthetase-like enzyme